MEVVSVDDKELPRGVIAPHRRSVKARRPGGRVRGSRRPTRCRTCARLRGLAFVAVMKAADFRNRDDRPSGRWRDWSGVWRVLLEAKMRPAPMIVPGVKGKEASQVRLIEHDHVIQAFSPD